MSTLQSIKKIFSASLVFSFTLFISAQASAQLIPQIDIALATANRWVVLADVNQAERMWGSSGPVMQKNVTKEDWINYLSKLQTELGHVSSREWIQIVRIMNPSNLPQGEYVNVVFSSKFNKSPVVEKISLSRVAQKWVPVGYVVNKIESSSTPTAVLPAAAFSVAK